VTENRKTRKMSTLEVILRRLRNDALKGDAKAFKTLLPLAERYLNATESSQGDDIVAEDLRILAAFLPQLDRSDELKGESRIGRGADKSDAPNGSANDENV